MIEGNLTAKVNDLQQQLYTQVTLLLNLNLGSLIVLGDTEAELIRDNCFSLLQQKSVCAAHSLIDSNCSKLCRNIPFVH